MLQEAKQRSLSELLSTDGALDPKMFSIWTVTHSYDNAGGMPLWVLPTRQTHSLRPCVLKAINVSSTERKKIYLTTLQNIRCLPLHTFGQILLVSPTKAPHCRLHVSGHLIQHKLLKNQLHLHLDVRLCLQDVTEIILTWKIKYFGTKDRLASQPWSTSVIRYMTLPCNIKSDIVLAVTNSFLNRTPFKVC